MKKAVQKGLFLGVVFLIAIYIINIFLLNIFALDNNINSEIAFEIIFAKQIQREHTLFPIRFFYGYELSALRPAFLATLLDGFLHSAMLSYAWALNITLILLLISLVYFLKGLNLQWFEIVVSVLAWLAIPAYMFNAYVQYLYNGYFGFYTIVIFLILGIYVRLDGFLYKKICIYLVLLGIPSFIFGLMGARMLQMIYLPLALYEFICLFINIWQKKKVAFRLRQVIFSVCLLVSNLLGFALFTLFFSDKFIFNMIPSEVVFRPVEQLHESTTVTLAELLCAMGAYFGAPIISLKGMLYLATMAMAIIIIVATVLIIKYHYTAETPCIACLSILITFTICSLTWWKVMSRYFMMYSVLLAIVTALIIKYLIEKEQTFFINFLVICLMIVAIGNVGATYGAMLQIKNEPPSLQGVIGYLEDKGIPNCYGMSVGLEIGSLTNFEIDSAYVFYDEEKNEITFGSMSSYDSFDASKAKEKSALLVTNSDYEKYGEKWEEIEYFKDVVEVEQLWDYRVYVFDYNPFIDKNHMFD